MLDNQFATKLQELDTAGDVQGMRDFLKANGGMSRVIALAVRGATRAKRDGTKAKAGALPDDFPDAAARERAKAYWVANGRPDLADGIDRQVEKFRGHFEVIRRPSWPRTWGTWVRNAPDMTPPPRSFGQSNASVAFEQTTIDGWVSRLVIFHGGDQDCPEGTWSPKWGAKPGQQGCRVPPEALSAYSAKHGQRVALL
jgi:hypothetical protein